MLDPLTDPLTGRPYDGETIAAPVPVTNQLREQIYYTCPEHGDRCRGGNLCCCFDKHIPAPNSVRGFSAQGLSDQMRAATLYIISDEQVAADAIAVLLPLISAAITEAEQKARDGMADFLVEQGWTNPAEVERHITEAKAEAWDEGYESAQADEFDNNQRPEDRTVNPYRTPKETPNAD